MLTPDQFEVNDAWIAVRINEEFLFVKEDPYDMFVLMDAASDQRQLFFPVDDN